MKMAAVIPKLVTFDMDGSLSNPRFTWSQKHIVLVFVVTESGTVGVGEAWASGAAPDALMATISDDLAPPIVGQDALAISRHWAALNDAALVSARRGIFRTGQAAIDIALWDLLGKAANLPVFRLLGGFSDSAAVYASAGLYGSQKTTANLTDEMTGYVSQGFDAVKMKVGGAPHAEDVDRVRAVREAIGPGVRLMVDGVYALDPPSALRLSKAIEPYDQESLDAWRNDPNHDVTLPYYGFDHVRICLMHGDQVHGHYGRWLEEKHPGSDSLRGESMLRGGDNVLPSDIVVPFGWRTRVPEELYSTTYIADESIAYLDEHVKRGEGAPFFLKCSFPDPHHPYTPPGRYFDMYDPDGIPLPPSFGGDEDPLPPSLDYLRGQRGNRDLDVASFWGMAVNEREAREAIALTYGQITMIDDAVGRILSHLESLGLAENTVVVFTSDHGDYMGDHQLLMKGPLHYQGLIRVPFIWADPMRPPAEAACGAQCGSLDFAQTVLDRAGLQPFHGMQGKSLLPLLDGSESELYEDVLIEDENQLILLGFSGHPRVRTLVTKRWRMTLFDRVGWGELYDLENDPDEMRNCWDNSDFFDVKRTLMEAMVRKMMDYDDRSPFPTSRS